MTMTPQALGSLIKRTGILKSDDRKGNSYSYHTEGYTLTRQAGTKYTFNYYPRLQLALRTEAQEQAFNDRMQHAFSVVKQALESKGIYYYVDGGCLWIDLGATNGN
jgi:hypothetical protein